MYDPIESDWKIYTELVDGIEERFLEKRLAVTVALLQDKSQSALDRFGTVKEQLEKAGRDIKDCIARHSRSNIFPNVMQMHRSGLVDDEELKTFSDELQKALIRVDQIFGKR
jgi:hypothetical protein